VIVDTDFIHDLDSTLSGRQTQVKLVIYEVAVVWNLWPFVGFSCVC